MTLIYQQAVATNRRCQKCGGLIHSVPVDQNYPNEWMDYCFGCKEPR